MHALNSKTNNLSLLLVFYTSLTLRMLHLFFANPYWLLIAEKPF